MDIEDDALGRTVRTASGAGAQPDVDPPWVAECPAPVRPSLAIDRTATAHDIAVMRRSFATWLALDVAAGQQVDDLVLAVYEALANAADHAYGGGTGPVRLVAHRARLSVQVTVSDDGQWQPRTSAPFRNHGLSVIRTLVAQLHMASTGSGTTVHLRSAFPAPVRR